MSNLKGIQSQIEEGTTLKTIADAFSEVSALKLQTIRSSVLRNKDFSAELLELFTTIKQIAAHKNHMSKVLNSLIEKNGKRISVVITSNMRFYGALNKALMKFYIEQVQEDPTDLLVIGKIGVEYMKINRINLPYQTVIFHQDLPTQEELTKLIHLIYPYKTILLYHSQFKSVLRQEPVVTDVSGDSSELVVRNSPNTKYDIPYTDFILEPEIEKILSFFDSQILTLLTESIFLEEELSKTASRLLSMGGAQDNANAFIKEQRKLLFRAEKSIANNRLLGTYITFKNWKEQALKQ